MHLGIIRTIRVRWNLYNVKYSKRQPIILLDKLKEENKCHFYGRGNGLCWLVRSIVLSEELHIRHCQKGNEKASKG